MKFTGDAGTLSKTGGGGNTVRVVVAGCSPHEEFLAEGDMSFESLGVHPDVSDALLRAGFAKPAKVQVWIDQMSIFILLPMWATGVIDFNV